MRSIKNKFSKNILRNSVGHYVRVRFDDAGMTDGILVKVRNMDTREDYEVFCFSDKSVQHVSSDYFVDIGPLAMVPEF